MENSISIIHTFATISFIIISAIIVQYLRHNLYYWKRRGVPGPTPLPIFGNFLARLVTPLPDLENYRFRKYGRIYGTLEFSKPTIAVGEPAAIREIAIKNFGNFRNRYNPASSDKLLSEMVIFLEDDQWKGVRNLISPVFTNRQIKRMFSAVEKCSENIIQYMNGVVDTEISLKQLMMSFTLDTIAKCAFGVDVNSSENPEQQFVKNALEASKLSTWSLFKTLIIPKRFKNIFDAHIVPQKLRDYFREIIYSIIVHRKHSKVERDDFINILISNEQCKETQIDNSDENLLSQTIDDSNLMDNAMRTKSAKTTLTEDEIVAQCFSFFTAGYETTSSLLTFTLYSLAMNPEIQEKLHQEVKMYFQNKDNIDYESLNSLQYLDCVINETLRMYTPLAVMDRIVENDCVLGDTGIKLEKGTIVNLPFYAIHNDPHFFAEPRMYKPERFLPENRHLIQPFTFMPFGVGPRSCVGVRFALMNAKIFLVNFVNRFKVEKTKNTDLIPRYKPSHNVITIAPLLVRLSTRT